MSSAISAAFCAATAFARRNLGGGDQVWFKLGRSAANLIQMVVVDGFTYWLTRDWAQAAAAGLAVFALWSPGHGFLYDIGTGGPIYKKSTMDYFIAIALEDVVGHWSERIRDILGMIIRYSAYGAAACGTIMNIPSWVHGTGTSWVPFASFGVAGLLITAAYVLFHDLKVAGKLPTGLPAWTGINVEYYSWAEWVVGALSAAAVVATIIK